MKPFLLLASRPEDAAADNEYASFLAFAGLDERDLHRVRLEQRPLGGLGIHLMRQIMRDIEYHRVDGWNRIRMRRPIPAEAT